MFSATVIQSISLASAFIGVSIPDLGNEVFAQVLEGIERKLGMFGFQTVLGVSLHDAETMANAAGSRLGGSARRLPMAAGAWCRPMLPDQPGFYPGFYGTEQLLARQPMIDAIYYQNDNMAAGGMMHGLSKGLRIPADLGIAGWGDLPIASILPGRLTASHVAPLQIGLIAADKLLATLTGRPVEPVTDTGFRLVPGNTL